MGGSSYAAGKSCNAGHDLMAMASPMLAAVRCVDHLLENGHRPFTVAADCAPTVREFIARTHEMRPTGTRQIVNETIRTRNSVTNGAQIVGTHHARSCVSLCSRRRIENRLSGSPAGQPYRGQLGARPTLWRSPHRGVTLPTQGRQSQSLQCSAQISGRAAHALPDAGGHLAADERSWLPRAIPRTEHREDVQHPAIDVDNPRRRSRPAHPAKAEFHL